MTQPEFVDVTFYVTVEPVYWNGWRDSLKGGRTVKVTQKKPSVLENGAIAVKLTLRVPRGVFDPYRPEAIVEIPEGAIIRTVDVEVHEAQAADDAAEIRA